MDGYAGWVKRTAQKGREHSSNSSCQERLDASHGSARLR